MNATNHEALMMYFFEHLVLLEAAFPETIRRIRPIDEMQNAFVIDLVFFSTHQAENYKRYLHATMGSRSFDSYNYATEPQHNDAGLPYWRMRLRCNVGVAGVASWFVRMATGLRGSRNLGALYVKKIMKTLKEHGFEDTRHPHRRNMAVFRYDPQKFNFHEGL
jgi:hypothetical protein